MLGKLTRLSILFITFHVYSQTVVEIHATPIKDLDPLENLTDEISSSELERTKHQNSHHVFKDISGINGNETFSQIFMRGGETYHTLVIVDGVILNDPSSPNRSFDFSQIRFLDIEEIKIFKGPSAALFGEGITGAIVIKTKTGKQKKTNITAGYGSYQKYLVSASAGNKKNKFSYFIQTDYETEEGKSQKNSPGGKDELDQKKYSQIGVNTLYEFKSRSRFGFLSKFNNNYQEIDSFLGDRAGFYSENKTMLGKINFDFEIDSDLDANSISYSYSRHNRDTHDDWNTRFKSENHLFKIQSKLRLTDYQHLTGEYFYKQESDLSPNPSVQKKKYYENSFAILHTLDLNPLETTYSMRFNTTEMDDNLPSVYLKNSIRLNPALLAGLQLGNSYQIPSLYQVSDLVYGNPDLKIEKSQSYELFLKYAKNRFNYQQSFYLTRIKDKFSYDPQTYRTTNGNRADIRGLESTIIYQLENGLELRVGFERLRTFSYETKKQLTRRPSYKYSSGVKFNEYKLQGVWVGRSDDVNGVNSSYYTFDFSYQKKLAGSLLMTFYINNIFNKHYHEVLGYSPQERTFYAQLSWEMI